MIPGFIQFQSALPQVQAPGAAISAAGVWDTPKGECRYARTDTFCTGLVLWCREVSVCNNGSIFGQEQSKTPYPCGVCIGISDPSDW